MCIPLPPFPLFSCSSCIIQLFQGVQSPHFSCTFCSKSDSCTFSSSWMHSLVSKVTSLKSTLFRSYFLSEPSTTSFSTYLKFFLPSAPTPDTHKLSILPLLLSLQNCYRSASLVISSFPLKDLAPCMKLGRAGLSLEQKYFCFFLQNLLMCQEPLMISLDKSVGTTLCLQQKRLPAT